MAAKKSTKKESKAKEAAEEESKETSESKEERHEESGADHYEHFLDCMAAYDDAESKAEQKKWKKKATACFKKLEKHADELSAAKMKRARRIRKSLDD